jgi:hypothetical protein
MKNRDLCRSFEIVRWIFDKERYLLLWSMKVGSIWVKYFYSRALIRSSVVTHRRVDRWSRATSFDRSSRKFALCLSFSSLNNRLSDSFCASNSSTSTWKAPHVLKLSAICLKSWYIGCPKSLHAHYNSIQSCQQSRETRLADARCTCSSPHGLDTLPRVIRWTFGEITTQLVSWNFRCLTRERPKHWHFIAIVLKKTWESGTFCECR